jgi:hypothetical protein
MGADTVPSVAVVVAQIAVSDSLGAGDHRCGALVILGFPIPVRH